MGGDTKTEVVAGCGAVAETEVMGVTVEVSAAVATGGVAIVGALTSGVTTEGTTVGVTVTTGISGASALAGAVTVGVITIGAIMVGSVTGGISAVVVETVVAGGVEATGVGNSFGGVTGGVGSGVAMIKGFSTPSQIEASAGSEYNVKPINFIIMSASPEKACTKFLIAYL